MKAISVPRSACVAPELRVGDEVADGGLATAVLGAVRLPGARDVARDLADRAAADDLGLRDRVVHDALHRGIRRERRLPVGGEQRHELGGDGGERLGGGIHRERQVPEVRPVAAGLQDGERQGLARDREVVVVAEVGVAGDHGVDVGLHARDDAAEDRVVGEGGLVGGGRALVHDEHDHVGLAVRVVAVAERAGGGGGGVDDAADVERRDAGRAHELGQRLGGGADERDAHAVDVLHVVGRVRGLRRALLVEVRRDVGEVGCGDDAAVDVVAALVELVVAEGGDGDAHGVQRVDGGLVGLRQRREGRGADVVARADERAVRVLGLRLLERAGDHGGARGGGGGLEAAVEVVDRVDVDRDVPLGGGGGRGAEAERRGGGEAGHEGEGARADGAGARGSGRVAGGS
ncbi:hypothetical protein ABID70_000376 [Clavibacter michiganensis]